jgi:hypothetical protein
MRLSIILAAALLAAGVLLGACGGDGDEQEVGSDAVDAIEDLSAEIESQLEDADVDELEEGARLELDQSCTQLSEAAADSSLGDELTDVCGDIRQALTEGSQQALDEARERLGEVLAE